MSAVECVVWLGALAFLAFLTLGWGRWFRWTVKEDGDLVGPLIFGGIGLLAIYAAVLSPTYYLLVGAR